MDSYHGVWRIQGSLAVSRGIGDRHLKQWVTAEPETKVVEIKAEHEFLILASDGLWEKVRDTILAFLLSVPFQSPMMYIFNPIGYMLEELIEFYFVLCLQVSNQEAVDIARPSCLGTNGKEMMVACRKLVDLSASRGSCDDISVMLVKLKPYM